MTFGEIIAAIGEHARVLWPFRIVRAWEQGVRITSGVIDGLCTHENGVRGTGLHIFWPVVGDIRVMESNIEIAETQDQTLTTLDGQSVVIAMSARFRIRDMTQLYAEVHDHEKTIRNAIEALVGETVPTLRWRQRGFARRFEETLVEATEGELVKILNSWGVALEALSVRTCVKAQALRLFQGEQRDHVLV